MADLGYCLGFMQLDFFILNFRVFFAVFYVAFVTARGHHLQGSVKRV